MFDRAFDIDDHARLDGLFLIAGKERRSTADDVVNFILGVRPLRVGLTSLEMVDSHAQRCNSQELQPRAIGLGPFCEKLTDGKRLHKALAPFARIMVMNPRRLSE